MVAAYKIETFERNFNQNIVSLLHAAIVEAPQAASAPLQMLMYAEALRQEEVMTPYQTRFQLPGARASASSQSKKIRKYNQTRASV